MKTKSGVWTKWAIGEPAVVGLRESQFIQEVLCAIDCGLKAKSDLLYTDALHSNGFFLKKNPHSMVPAWICVL
jgi:hypothetical protein